MDIPASAYGPTVVNERTTANLRCDQCHKLLAELVTAPYRLICHRCHAVNCQP